MTSNEGTCRRCSVIRVNTLCRLYDKAFNDQDSHAGKQLKSLVKIAKERGYADGMKVLSPSLTSDYVRKLCWNVSSLLTDQDLLYHGVNVNGRRRPS